MQDRSNDRMQVFDNQGTYLFEWDIPGSNQAVFDDDGMVHSPSNGQVWVSTPDGKNLGSWGEMGPEPWQFTGGPHGIWMDNTGAVYVGQVGAKNGLNKFVRV